MIVSLKLAAALMWAGATLAADDVLPLTIHTMPHTHCDTGYKKTFEGYFSTEVRPIFFSLVNALTSEDDARPRRFIWSETAFLKRWFEGPRDLEDIAAQRSWARLVSDGTIEIVDGGFTQHDDAITTFAQQLQNMRVGHRWLVKTFGEVAKPRYGWHPDSFGATSVTPTLYALAGMDAVVHDRMDNDIKNSLTSAQSLEFMWQGSSSLEFERSAIPTHIMGTHSGYSSPKCFDWRENKSPNLPTYTCDPVTDDNVGELSDQYVAEAVDRASGFLHGMVLIPFGQDFRFLNASFQFENMDKIVSYINSNPDRYRELHGREISIRYSTMHDYFSAIARPIRERGLTFPVVEGSPFMPYWSGYYAGFPKLKRQYSDAISLLRHAEAAVASLVVEESAFRSGVSHAHAAFIQQATEHLDAANAHIALVSHHDAIPGTGYSFFTRDTFRRLAEARAILLEVIEATIGRTIATGHHGVVGNGHDSHLEIAIGAVPSARVPFALYSGDEDRPLVVRKDEETTWVCPPMGESVRLHVLNSLPWSDTRLISVPTCRDDVAVIDASTGEPVHAQCDRSVTDDGSFILSFGPVELPPMGRQELDVIVPFVTTNTDQFPDMPDWASLRSAESSSSGSSIQPNANPEDAANTHSKGSISSDEYTVYFSSERGIEAVWVEAMQLNVTLRHAFHLYSGSGSNAYKFQDPGLHEDFDNGTDLEVRGGYDWFAEVGELVQSVRLAPKDLALPDDYDNTFDMSVADINIKSITVRLVSSGEAASHIELEYDLGTIERGIQQKGYNLAVRVGPGPQFWSETSAGACTATYLENGYEPIASTYMRRYSIGQNHRPTPTGAIMSCGETGARSMHVLGTHGHSHVMIPGSTDLEFLLHRRAPMEQTPTIFYDWRKGDDAAAIRTTLRLGLFDTAESSSWARQAKSSAQLDVAPLVLKAPPLYDWGHPGSSVVREGRRQAPPERPFSSLLKTALPEQVTMLHFALEEGDDNEQARGGTRVLMTLQHLGAVDDDHTREAIDVGELLSVPIGEVEEVGLTYVYSADEAGRRMRWPVEGMEDRASDTGGCLHEGKVLLAPHDSCALRVFLGE